MSCAIMKLILEYKIISTAMHNENINKIETKIFCFMTP